MLVLSGASSSKSTGFPIISIILLASSIVIMFSSLLAFICRSSHIRASISEMISWPSSLFSKWNFKLSRYDFNISYASASNVKAYPPMLAFIVSFIVVFFICVLFVRSQTFYCFGNYEYYWSLYSNSVALNNLHYVYYS